MFLLDSPSTSLLELSYVDRRWLIGQFKQISIAYQILSDPELRHKYNEFGQKNGGGSTEPAGGFQDPEEVFGKMFGGDKFEDLIGQISIGTSCSLLHRRFPIFSRPFLGYSLDYLLSDHVNQS